MKHNFTKNEWILNEERSEIISSNNCSKNGGIDIIAQCFCGFNHISTIQEAKANAKLIASAPDLLYALQEMLRVFGGIAEVFDEKETKVKAKRAIEKALS